MEREKGRNKKATGARAEKIILNKTHTQYVSVSRACKALGWTTTVDYIDNEDLDMGKSQFRSKLDWNVYWTDSGQNIDKLVRNAKSFQKINHFPGMVNIYRKSNLARSMLKMQKIDAKAYDFYPKTWVLPQEASEVTKYLNANVSGSSDSRCVIIKPSGGAQGRGIYLAMHPNRVLTSEDAVAQVYVSRPLLIDGYKFDLRIYALIVSCDPLRILIYREGLVRLCTTKYEGPNYGNVDCVYMHLTNYSVNKHNSCFVQNDGEDESEASKRSLTWLWDWMDERGLNSQGAWADICDVIVKSLISVHANLLQAYRACKIDAESKTPFTCFELLGFDVMLTDKLKPILIEVNHTPSFKTDSALDAHVKDALLQNTLKVLNVSAQDRQKYVTRTAAMSQMRLYGGLFDGSPRSRQKVSNSRLEDCRTLWTSYLANERACLGNFDVVFPANETPQQPTAGRQEHYAGLLRKAYEAHYGDSGALLSLETEVSSPVQPTDSRDLASGAHSESPTSVSPRSASAQAKRQTVGVRVMPTRARGSSAGLAKKTRPPRSQKRAPRAGSSADKGGGQRAGERKEEEERESGGDAVAEEEQVQHRSSQAGDGREEASGIDGHLYESFQLLDADTDTEVVSPPSPERPPLTLDSMWWRQPLPVSPEAEESPRTEEEIEAETSDAFVHNFSRTPDSPETSPSRASPRCSPVTKKVSCLRDGKDPACPKVQEVEGAPTVQGESGAPEKQKIEALRVKYAQYRAEWMENYRKKVNPN